MWCLWLETVSREKTEPAVAPTPEEALGAPREVPAPVTEWEENVPSPEGKGGWAMWDRPMGGQCPRTGLKSLFSPAQPQGVREPPMTLSAFFWHGHRMAR